MLGSIALGADDELSPGAREAFRASGLAHLLAVSGGNVALLVAAVLVLVWVAGGTRVGGHVGRWSAVVGYVGLVGPSPSVVRAGVAGVLARRRGCCRGRPIRGTCTRPGLRCCCA